ncbi:MAG: CoA transferase, partial [Gammaproteobacteria bacterium]|nr:CoA transferase [Gammaproteobacteria bacterium]
AEHSELGTVRLIRSPINLSAHPQGDRFERAAPDPGQDSEAILAEFGCAPSEIEALRRAGVI